MSKSLSRNLYLLSILLTIIGGLSLARGVMENPNPLHSTVNQLAHSLWLDVGAILVFVAGLLVFAAWIGALIRTAQLGRWIWFVFLILFSGLTLLLYIFFGPKTPTRAYIAAHAPPAGGFGY